MGIAGTSTTMKKNCGSLFVETRMEEKTEVSKVPQDMKVRSVEKDSSKDVGIPFETEVSLLKRAKLPKKKCQKKRTAAVASVRE